MWHFSILCVCRGSSHDFRFEVIAVRSYPLYQLRNRRFAMAHAQSAFPNHCHTPTGRTKLVPRPKIALDVRGKLFGPEVLVGAGCRTPMAATVAMPEAAVDQDHNPMSRQHHIGATRQVARVKAKAEAGPV
jgi:hypothetical protein